MRPTGKRRGPTEEVRQVWVIRLRSHCAQFRYPQLQCMRMPYTAHTCVDPISAKPTSRSDHGSIRRQRFRAFAIHPCIQQSPYTDGPRIEHSRARPSHGMARTEGDHNTYGTTLSCGQCPSLQWNNTPRPPPFEVARCNL